VAPFGLREPFLDMNFFPRCHAPLRNARAQAPTLLIVIIVVLAIFALNMGRGGGLPQQKFIFFFLALITFVLAFMRTNFALAILILSMLLSPEIDLAKLPDRSIAIRLDDILIIVIFFGWLAKLAVFKELGLLKRTLLNGPILLYVFMCLLSTGVMLILGGGNFVRSLFYMLKYFEYFLLFFLVVNNIQDMRQVRLFLLLIFFTCLVVSCYALYTYFGGGSRATAPFEGKGGEANTLGGYLVLVLPLVISTLIHNGLPRYKLQLWVLLAVGGLALLFTLSRGSWVGFIVACGVLAFSIRQNRAIFFFFLAILGGVMVLMAPRVVRQRVERTFEGSYHYRFAGQTVTIDESAASRIESWNLGKKKVLQRPVIGHGIPGHGVMDNQYIRVTTEVGLVGLCAFLFLLSRIYHAGRLARLASPSHPLAQSIAVGFGAAFFGLLVHALSAATFIIIRIMEPFWFLVAIIVVMPGLIKSPVAQPQIFEGT